MLALASYGIFTAVHYFLREKGCLPHSISNNIVAGTHALTSVLGGGLYLYTQSPSTWNIVSSISSGYFSYDMSYILFSGKRSLLNYLYLYHHFASIYLINHDPTIYLGGDVLFWAELSNLPTYVVYYHIKNKSSQKTLLFWKKIQIATYSAIRLPILTYITYKGLTTVEDRNPIYVAMPVYFMGILWIGNLYRSL